MGVNTTHQIYIQKRGQMSSSCSFFPPHNCLLSIVVACFLINWTVCEKGTKAGIINMSTGYPVIKPTFSQRKLISNNTTTYRTKCQSAMSHITLVHRLKISTLSSPQATNNKPWAEHGRWRMLRCPLCYIYPPYKVCGLMLSAP